MNANAHNWMNVDRLDKNKRQQMRADIEINEYIEERGLEWP